MTPRLQPTQRLIAGHRRWTSNTWGVKHRSMVRGTIVSTYCDTPAGQPRLYVSASLHLQVFHHLLHRPDHAFRGRHLRFPACFNIYATIWAGSGVATSHKAMDLSHWQRRRLQWRQVQEPKSRASGTLASVACSSESIVFQRTTSA
jgi:hypothetical protein